MPPRLFAPFVLSTWKRAGVIRWGLGPRLQLAIRLRQPLRERRVQAPHLGGPGDQRLIGHVPARAEGQRQVLLTPPARGT